MKSIALLKYILFTPLSRIPQTICITPITIANFILKEFIVESLFYADPQAPSKPNNGVHPSINFPLKHVLE